MIPQYHYKGQYWFVCELKDPMAKMKIDEVIQVISDHVGHFVQYTYERNHDWEPAYDLLFADEDDALMFKLLYSEL